MGPQGAFERDGVGMGVTNHLHDISPFDIHTALHAFK